MTCRHKWGDENCSSFENQLRRSVDLALKQDLEKAMGLVKKHAPEALLPETPDSQKYDIVEIHREGPHLVVKAKYPNCEKCSYEGTKVMVFLNVSEIDVIRWKKIDPHFSEHMNAFNKAPSPAARFPASEQGWKDAIAYAKHKAASKKKGGYVSEGDPYHVCLADDCCTRKERNANLAARVKHNKLK